MPHQINATVPLGRFLVDSGLVDEAGVEAALAFAANSGLKLGQALLALGLIDEHGLAEALRQQGRIACIRLAPGLVDVAVARQLGAQHARRMNAVAINRIAGVTTVALEDPTDGFMVEELAAHLNTPVLAVHAEPARIRECVHAVFGPEEQEDARTSRPPLWARDALDAAAANDAVVLVIEARGDQLRLHAASTGCCISAAVPPRACAASVDGLLALAAANESARSSVCASITRTDPTVSTR